MEEYPMHRAADDGDIEKVKSFIEDGMSVDSLDNNKYTPLHRAAKGGHLKLAEFLIGRKSGLDLKTTTDCTPVLMAAECGHQNIVELLLRSGADGNSCREIGDLTLLHHAARRGWTETVKLLVENRNTKLDAKTILGTTSLLLAAYKGHRDVIELLLQAGANIHACNAIGETPLHIACRGKDIEIVKTLLLAGADANCKNYADKTAFHLAVEQKKPFFLEVVKLLIEHGTYLRYNDMISHKILLKELVLKDVDLCTQLLINKFNHQSLPDVYKKLEYVEKLPRICKLNIWNSPGVGGGIAKCVESEIETKTFCDVMKVRPMVLTLMCVQALINPQKTKKKRPTHQGPVKRSARLALLNMEGSAKKK